VGRRSAAPRCEMAWSPARAAHHLRTALPAPPGVSRLQAAPGAAGPAAACRRCAAAGEPSCGPRVHTRQDPKLTARLSGADPLRAGGEGADPAGEGAGAAGARPDAHRAQGGGAALRCARRRVHAAAGRR
jgi:hypothetical protein